MAGEILVIVGAIVVPFPLVVEPVDEVVDADVVVEVIVVPVVPVGEATQLLPT